MEFENKDAELDFYHSLRIDLNRHIMNYIPSNATCPIQEIYNVIPKALEGHGKMLMALHERGKLESRLERLGKAQKSYLRFFGQKKCFREAITDFFDKELYKHCEVELQPKE